MNINILYEVKSKIVKGFMEKKDLNKNYNHFINREMSWLEFNLRIIEEAENTQNPLLERLKFLAIASDNLDQFFMIRVAGLNEQVTSGVNKISQDGLTAQQQLDLIHKRTQILIKKQNKCLKQIQKELKINNINFISNNKINKDDKAWLEKYFFENIFPILSPRVVGEEHPFPYITNLGLGIILNRITNPKSEASSILNIILLPTGLQRFVAIKDSMNFIAIEDIIYMFKEKIFLGDKIDVFSLFKITRDSDLDIEEAEDLVQNFQKIVHMRDRGSIVRLEVDKKMPKHIFEFLKNEIKVTSNQVFENNTFLNMYSMQALYSHINISNLKYKTYIPKIPQIINDHDGDCFAAIKEKDLIFHHPYESFDPVLRFLEQSAQDPDVVSIKQTLYRTSADSPVIKSLIEAANNGKSVTVVVELKARFDEEANFKWGKNLERAGAQVIFGLKSLKTHAKISLVIRREKGRLKSYAHFGTGNYNSVTAKIYSDISFFTSNDDLCNDASYIFNYLTGFFLPAKFNKVSLSPISLRKNIVSLIENETNNARKGKKANIWIKVNSLIDAEIIEKLYIASQAGVVIKLIVRSLCALKPKVSGLSDNITVKSIVGRYLEHSRIYCFGNGGSLPSNNAKVFISSADCMQRNLDRRVEVLVPIEDKEAKERLLKQIMAANLQDKSNSWCLDSEGSYIRKKTKKEQFSIFNYFMENLDSPRFKKPKSTS